MRIAIAGGGLGGLTLAAFLRRAGHEPLVLERDQEVGSRSQGYALGMKEDGGLAVLSALGLMDRVEAIGVPAADFAFLTPGGKRLMGLRARPGTPGYTLGVPRSGLRALLLEAAGGEEAIRTGARVTDYETGNGTVRVGLESGETLEADLLVGADGVRSQVRARMLGDPLKPLRLFQLGGLLTGGAGPAHPLLEAGAFMTLGRGASLFVQRYAQQGETIWSYCTHGDGEALTSLSHEERIAWVLERVGDWHEPIASVITATTPGETALRTYSDRDPRDSYVDGRVVLIGDAAHPMSPFQGQGANMAMLDGQTLAEALTGATEADLTERIAAWDRAAARRVKPMVMRSRQAAAMFHAQGAFTSALRNGALRLMGAMIPG